MSWLTQTRLLKLESNNKSLKDCCSISVTTCCCWVGKKKVADRTIQWRKQQRKRGFGKPKLTYVSLLDNEIKLRLLKPEAAVWSAQTQPRTYVCLVLPVRHVVNARKGEKTGQEDIVVRCVFSRLHRRRHRLCDVILLEGETKEKEKASNSDLVLLVIETRLVAAGICKRIAWNPMTHLLMVLLELSCWIHCCLWFQRKPLTKVISKKLELVSWSFACCQNINVFVAERIALTYKTIFSHF